MSLDLTLGAIAGALLGLGLLVLLSARRRARPALAARLAPHLRDGRARPADIEAVRGPVGALVRVAGPVLRDGAAVLEKLGSTGESIRTRLHRLGSRASVEQFRLEQALWAAGGLALALLLALVLRPGLPVVALLLVIGTLGGAVARDQVLTRQVAARQERWQEQLPDVAELLALAVGAGESATGALDRVAATAHGELADEIRAVVHDTRAGTPLTAALGDLASRTGVPAVARFAEGVAVAVERGTPLAEVLRAQAADARAARRRELMELGGKKEISMMAPVVFLILPVTVLFALFPGLAVLEVGV